ncbi:hypothetical protein CR513_47573, partial [Mucuna pruriens]
MRQMPKVCESPRGTPGTFTLGRIALAISQVESGHSWPFPSSSKTTQILDSSSELLHQVGRGGTGRHNHGRKGQAFLLEENHMLLWYTGGDRFASQVIDDFCKGLQIKQSFTSVEHPQSNGQAEVVNKGCGDAWKKRREDGRRSSPRYFGSTIPRPILRLMRLLFD